jgi:glycosyltransferase involved in cell wall biosynthesis
LKIVIYFEEEFLGVYPSLINCITLLSPVCSSIQVISGERESNFPNPPKFPANVSFHKVHQRLNYDRNQYDIPIKTNQPKIISHDSFPLWKKLIPQSVKIIFRITRNLWLENLNRWEEQSHWFMDKIKYYFFCLRKAWNGKPTVLIAVDESGLIAASLVSLICRNPKPELVFWSLETGLDTGNSRLFLQRLHEMFFSICARFLDILVIQEKSRINDLEKRLSHSLSNYTKFLIPHSPIRKSEILQYGPYDTGNFFREMFSLTESDKIILHAGWIHDAMCVDKMAKASKSWKSNFKLVLHERERRSPKETFIRHVSDLSDDTVLLSLNPVTFDRIDEVVSSAHIGLIAYDNKYGAGRVNILKASGKLAQYLKCGVPVIALDLPGYKQMFEKYKCGMVFRDFDEIEKCIVTILDNYDSFSRASICCFLEEFDFKKYFSPFSNHLLYANQST